MAPRRCAGCFYNTVTSRKPSQWHRPLSQVHESRGSWQKSTSESHIHLWNALLLPQICEPSPSAIKLKYANRLLRELHVDTETDMYFLEAPFVKEIVAHSEQYKRIQQAPTPTHLPILPLDECWVNGLHSDGYAWKIGGRLSDTHICIYRGGPENNTQRARRDRGSACFKTYRQWNNRFKCAKSSKTCM